LVAVELLQLVPLAMYLLAILPLVLQPEQRVP
jgi:hypothetical protein